MYTKEQLKEQVANLGISPQDTLLIHSSMKAIGEVEGGAETVLDVFSEYMHDGLLILPTHTWRQVGSDKFVFDVNNEPSCVGILTELFRKRPGVIRSWHPTHSVAALGKDADSYVQGEEKRSSPCPREGCWGRLYDRRAKILFLGCDLTRNTIIHGVEEWNNIPNRLTDGHQALQVLTPNGDLLDAPSRRHSSPIPDVSKNYDKLAAPMLVKGIAHVGQVGDARTVLCDVVPMVDLTSEFLQRNPDIFLDDAPIPEEWYTNLKIM